MKLVSVSWDAQGNRYFLFFNTETFEYEVKVRVLDELWTRRRVRGKKYIPMYTRKEADKFIRSLTT